ncbi:MFS transporter [Candidatus Roseilinea sp. NK_OTU-006]|jgi:MFS family permease|nr:MFS transporter [Candidatus Roseilinea sp. NK_OTU-006]
MMRPRFPALASRDFRIFWITQLISLIGTWMQNTVQAYLAYRITGQPIYLGLIGVASSVPSLLFTLPGGVWVEGLDKRKTVIAFQALMMAQALALACLTLTGVVTIWWITGLSFVLGAANSIEITARQAMMVEVVGKAGLPNAIALNSTAFNVARVVGPALSAPLLLIFAERGEGWAFLLNGVSYLVVILGLLAIHPKAADRAAAGEHPAIASPNDALARFREGQRYIRQTTLIGLIIIMAAVPGLLAFPVIQQIPAFARDVLAQPGDTDAAVAARNSAMVTAQGVGALLAATMLALLSAFRRKGCLMTAGQFAFSIALLGIGLSRNIALTLPILTLFGWGTVTALATSNTIIQLVTPNALRGRVISTYLWALQGVAPFGSLLIGWIAQTWDAPTAALFSGLACLATHIVIHLKTPTVRRFEG